MRALRRRAYRCATLGGATEAPRADPLMARSTGARPGPDKILSLLRQGEMGEAYPTRDAELGREHRRNRSCLVAQRRVILPRGLSVVQDKTRNRSVLSGATAGLLLRARSLRRIMLLTCLRRL